MQRKYIILIVSLVATIVAIVAMRHIFWGTTTPPDDEIWYTTTDGESLGLNNSLLSDKYKNGRGVLKFNNGELFNFVYSDIFRDKYTLESVILPKSVTGIRTSAFRGCCSLTSITIPDGVSSVGGRAFEGCISLTSVNIPDGVSSVGGRAFEGCSSLTSVTIPDGVTSIGAYAFSGCSSLTSITIPDGVTSIGPYAFSGCSSLTSVTIPDGVTSIDDSTFEVCSSLTSITIPDGVTSIGDRAFVGCSSLTSITIPDGVTSIGDRAFWRCDSLQEFKGKFASNDGRCIIIKGVLKYVAAAGLTEYTIPDSVTRISRYSFLGCDSLTRITFPGSIFVIEEDALSEFQGEVVLNTGDVRGEDCGIRSVIFSDSVTWISRNAFINNYNLKSVTIGKNVTGVGGSAFWDCPALKHIYCKATTPPDYDPLGKYVYYLIASRDVVIYVPRNSVSAYKASKQWGKHPIEPYDF